MENSTQDNNNQGAFSRKNNFSTKTIGKKKMSKSAQMKEEQRAKIREQFLRDLFTEDKSESGFSIFKEKEHESKRYRSEVKIQIGGHKAINAEEPKKHRSEVKTQVNKPKVVKVEKPKRFKSEVKIQLKKPNEKPTRPIRKAPDIPDGVSPWKPTPKPRTVLPKRRTKPRKKLQMVKPTPPPRKRKPVNPSKEVEQQPPVITPEEHEIDPFGTDLKVPGHRKIETAAKGAAVTYSITPSHIDPLDQLTSSRQVVRNILVNELKRMGGLKYTETLKVRMSKEVGNDKTRKGSVYFKSKTGTVTNFEDIESTAIYNQQMILARIETFQNLGSNWIIMNIESHYINVAMYKPLAGSTYMKLPEDISNSKCGLINIRNDDNMCFMWCHVRHLRPKSRRATAITQKDREFELELDYKGIEFPVKISDIRKIERKNKINISVLGYKGKKKFYPIRISKGEYEDHMELLLLGDDNGKLHYVLIKDVNRLLYSVSKSKSKMHYCLNCFHNCVSEDSLDKHRETCLDVNGVQATRLPKKGTKIKFKNHRNQIPVPFVIYADFESLLVSDKDRKEDTTVDESFTNRYRTHQACSFGLKTVCYYDHSYSGEYISYVGTDAAYVFLQTVIKEAARCKRGVNTVFKKKMIITPKQEREFLDAKDCSICGEPLKEDRVRDHCHITGLYRGAARNICNLKYSISWKSQWSSII
jgi:hypothetical protein